MKRLLLAPLLLILLPSVFADERQREIEYEAINIVIQKYGKGLENRLKGTGLKPSYRSWYENDCFCKCCCWYSPRIYLVSYGMVQR